MSRLSTTFATAGAAALLVVASFAAGAAASPATAPASVPASAVGTPPPPNRDALAEPDDVTPMAITTSPELLYVPITQCRIADSRPGSPFGDEQTRTYYVGGTFGFSPQGGTSGGCGVPTGAVSAVVNILAYHPSGAGRIKAWAPATPEPSGAVLWYPKSTTGGTVQQANVKLRSGAGTDLALSNTGGPTEVLIDVVGYYVPQLQAYISSSGTVIDQSGRLVSATKTGTGTYTLVWDRDISTCSGVASSDLTGHTMSVYTSGTSSYIYSVNNAGGAEDYWFNVAIHC
ncbi:hypothetical protein [Microbacterium terricola]|uniref:Secreted protein n=1 Tax=Microbacterium terricola TaxID=344163 RepID=A0ABM8DUZ9_9MICO|nr:hypothetical protein [Microbacterium terricola]UYK39816.1 hypothetical protein OAU46_14135 [Microbacterium terricola]BDV29432.1 hypothetical protein Microterr_00920 [Microbacterium terricola]